MTATAARRTPCRRFGLLDAMILVVGLAVGTVAFSPLYLYHWQRFEGSITPLGWVSLALDTSSIALMLSSILILIMRLRRPRPALRRIARQPGAVACFIAVFLTVGELYARMAFQVSQWDGVGNFLGELFWALRTLEPGYQVSFAIAATWMIYKIGRIGRPEASWIERSGRFTGWCWIVWGVGVQYLMNLLDRGFS